MDVEPEPIVGFPLRGTWLIVNPPGHPAHAFDISAIDAKGRPFSTSTFRMIIGLGRAEHLLGSGRPVDAPVVGEVVAAVDGIPDRERLVPIVDIPASFLIRPARAKGNLAMLVGNHVMIAAHGLFALLAHLRRGSVRVAPGDRVREGQQLGAIGNSGNTLSPHLHFHIMHGLDFAEAKVVPFRVRQFEYRDGGHWVGARNERLPRRLIRVRVSPPAQQTAPLGR